MNWTPLFYAVKSGNAQCVQLLMEKSSVDPLSKDRTGNIALHLACEKFELEIIELLIKAKPESVFVKNISEQTPLHFAIICQRSVEIIDILCINGVIVDEVDTNGHSALTLALKFGNVEAVIYLLYSAKANWRGLKEKGIDCMGILLEKNKSDFNRKVACFKVLYNFMNPDHNWRPTYASKDIFKFGILSILSRKTSLIPYFSENLSDNHHRNDHAIDLITKNPSYLDELTELMKFVLLNEDSHEFLKDKYIMEIANGRIREFLSELMMGSEEAYEVVFKTIVVSGKKIIRYFIGDLFLVCISFNDDPFEQAEDEEPILFYPERTLDAVNLVLTETDITAVELYYHLLFDNGPFAEKLKQEILKYWVSDFHVNMVLGDATWNLFHKNTPSDIQLKDYKVYDSFFDNNSLKKMCRDVIRRQLYEKYKHLISHFRKMTKDVEKRYLADLQKLPLPELLIDYLRFIQ